MPYLNDCKIYLEDYDLSGFSNRLELARSVEVPDFTVFGDTNRKTLAGGLETVRFTGGGYASLQDDAVEHKLDANFGTADAVLTVSPDAGAFGELAYLQTAMIVTVEQGGTVGDIYPFTFNANGQTQSIRGHILQPKLEKAGAGQGTSRQEGAIAATQTGYGALHIFAISDGTLTVTIYSDADDNWVAGTTARIAFGAQTVVGGTWKTVTDTVTDEYWRAEWTFSGTAATFAVGFGIR